MELKVGFVCDRGLNPKRPVNQDRYLAIPERGLFAVFDGVGGQRAGEVASQTAAETIEEALANFSAASSTELVRRAIQFANRDIFEMAQNDDAYKTMATTVALIHIDGDRATIAHVGDSRVYRLEDGRFYSETIDHTDLNDDIRAGVATSRTAGEPGSNVINRALGTDSDVDVEIKTISVREGARFLLCSDGIYRHLSDEQIARVLSENEDPQRAADELKRLVHADGADDNLTAVVVQMGRARLGRVISFEDGRRAGERTAGVAATARMAAGRGASEGRASEGRSPERGRIQVDFGGRGQERERASAAGRNSEWETRAERDYSRPVSRGSEGSFLRKLIYALVVLLLMGGAFYAGLRASDFIPGLGPAEDPDQGFRGQTVAGREAFESGDYTRATSTLVALLEVDPANAEARYWLGRTQMEQKNYVNAAQSFEQAISLRFNLYDAYVQAAAAYEMLGDRLRAQKMLERYSQERNKQAAPAAQATPAAQ